jgi:hypothetical protein
VLQLFKTNQILGAVLFIPYLGLFYSVNFLNIAERIEPAATPALFSLEYQDWPPYAVHLTAFFLVILQAVLLTLLVNANRLNNESNLFPGLFFCLFAGIIPEFMYPSPALLANTFLLLGLIELSAVYKMPVASARLFNVGLWISLASLFYFSSIWLLVFAFWGASTLRAFNIREPFTILLGAITPYLLVGTVFYVTDRLPEFWEAQFYENFRFADLHDAGDQILFVKLIVFALLTLISLIASGGYYQKKIMPAQKKITLLYGLLLFTGLSVLGQGQADITHWLPACLPLAVFFSMSFSVMPARWAEVVHLLMLAAGLFMAYSPYLVIF